MVQGVKHTIMFIIIVAISQVAWAAPSKPGVFELGVNLGEPSGVSAKLWLDGTSALEGIAAWAFTQGAFAFSVDYLYSFPTLVKVQTTSFPVFVGIGGVARITAGGGGPAPVTIGLRVPLGILYQFVKVPLEVSLDVVPGLNLFPDTSFLAMGGLAIRYRF
jgi:hypothetical protein